MPEDYVAVTRNRAISSWQRLALAGERHPAALLPAGAAPTRARGSGWLSGAVLLLANPSSATQHRAAPGTSQGCWAQPDKAQKFQRFLQTETLEELVLNADVGAWGYRKTINNQISTTNRTGAH